LQVGLDAGDEFVRKPAIVAELTAAEKSAAPESLGVIGGDELTEAHAAEERQDVMHRRLGEPRCCGARAIAAVDASVKAVPVRSPILPGFGSARFRRLPGFAESVIQSRANQMNSERAA
jgi:hypothetical protein